MTHLFARRAVSPALVLVTCTSLIFASPVMAASKPADAVTNLDDVEKATLYISARGRYWDYDTSAQKTGNWTGSGFIINDSGVAVTNNHVVAGASSLQIQIGGTGDVINAKVLGRSECSDLAVIKLDGDDYTYLNWYTSAPKVGLKIYAAGFPLSDPQFDLQDGIVSKAKAGGDTAWASVKQVIQHSASLNPGNSGGPLVTEEGEVVGVNYRSREAAKQYFAIARDEALPLITAMEAGRDIDTVGIAPEADAVTLGKTDFTGVRVTAIQSGSPADKAELKAGDFIYEMEGVTLAEDGTLKEFCRIVRSHKSGDAMSIKVLRTSTGELLEGQFNGRALKVTDQASSTTPEATPSAEVPSVLAADGEASLRVVNDTGEAIAGINIVSPETQGWGDNLLGDTTIADGDDFTISGIISGTYDVRALDADGKSMGSIYNVAFDGDLRWTVRGLAPLPAGATVKLEDDFSKDTDKWEPTNGDNVDMEVIDEAYSIHLKRENWLAWGTYEKFKTNGGFLAEVSCKLSSDDGLCGLGFESDKDNFLWLQVTPSTQEYNLGWLKAGKWQNDLISTTVSTYISPFGSNNIALGRKGKAINVYINGTLVDTVQSSAIPSGFVIFGGGTNKTDDVTVTLDDLTIWQVK